MIEIIAALIKGLVFGIPFVVTWWAGAWIIYSVLEKKKRLCDLAMFIWALVGVGPAITVASAVAKAVFGR